MRADMATFKRTLTPTLVFLSLTACILLTLLPLLPRPLLPLFTIRPSGQALSVVQATPIAAALFPLDHNPEAKVEVEAGTTESNASMMLSVPHDRIEYRPQLDGLDVVHNRHDAREVLEGSKAMSEEYAALRAAGLGEVEAEERSRAAWMGVHGPTVKVGAKTVCRIEEDKGEVCVELTDYTVNGTYAPLLLPMLGAYPIRTPGPILLVIALLCQIVLLLIHIASVLPLAHLSNLVCVPCRGRRPARHNTRGESVDTESVRELIMHASLPMLASNSMQNHADASGGGSKQCRPTAFYALLAFWFPAFAFGVAGASLMLAATMAAQRRWVDSGASGVGMVFELGPAVFLLGTLPFALILTLAAIVVPVLLHRRKKPCQLRAPQSELKAGAQGAPSSPPPAYGVTAPMPQSAGQQSTSSPTALGLSPPVIVEERRNTFGVSP